MQPQSRILKLPDTRVLNCQSVQREGRIVLSTDIHWAQPIAKIKELFAKYARTDVAVLQVILVPLTDRPFER